MAWLVMRLARIDMRSLYRHDMRAMGLKLLGSAVEFFLWIDTDSTTNEGDPRTLETRGRKETQTRLITRKKQKQADPQPP